MANNLPAEKKIMAISMLCENASIRAIERMTGVHRDTVMRLGVRVGEGCQKLLDSKMRGLNCERVEVDETWGFIYCKQKTTNAKQFSQDETGDIWTWIALDADTKLVPCFAIGDRSKYMAQNFIDDLAARVTGRIQITSDALVHYVDAIERAFGIQVDYGTVIKTFGYEELQQRRYSPPDVIKIKKASVQGSPEWDKISTSYVEKQNHTVRMHVRRLSRLTNAFSKKRENFEAAVALHFGYYNLVKIHGTIRMTPAMAAGVADSIWNVADLLEAIGEV